MKTNDFNEPFFVGCFFAVFVALQVGHYINILFCWLGNYFPFGETPIFRGHPPPWWWSRARRGGWWRRHGDVGRFGGETWENSCRWMRFGVQVMCFFFRCSILQKNRKNHGEDMVIQMMSLKLVDDFVWCMS